MGLQNDYSQVLKSCQYNLKEKTYDEAVEISLFPYLLLHRVSFFNMKWYVIDIRKKDQSAKTKPKHAKGQFISNALSNKLYHRITST